MSKTPHIYSKILSLILCIVLFITSFVIPVQASEIPNFSDIKASDWYYKAVYYMYENGYMVGTSNTQWSPNLHLDRAMLATVLYRMAGLPQVDTSNNEFHLDTNAYYYKALTWTAKSNIISPQNGDALPHAEVSRQEALSCIYKFLVYYGKVKNYESSNSYKNYEDGNQVSDWARKAVSWALDNGIIVGTSKTTISPRDALTRAELALITQRTECIRKNHNITAKKLSDATCSVGEIWEKTCTDCNKSFQYQTGDRAAHEYKQIVITKEATTSSPVKYKFKCCACGHVDSTEKSLGYKQNGSKPARDTANLTYPLKATSGSASVEVTRKWFGGSWCYIADIKLPKNQYYHWHAADAQTSTGESTTKTGLAAAKDFGAILLINGDANNGGIEADGYWVRARDGKFYGRDLYRSWANYWNKNTGAYGRCSEFGQTIKTLVDNGKITDTAAFWSGLFVYKNKMQIVEEKNPDSRRQRTFMGFKTDGDTVHVYAVVADGWTGQGSTPYNLTFSNDGSSYGMTGFEETCLLISLGCDFGIPLDGGHSSVMVFKKGSQWYELNAASYKMPGYNAIGSRSLWDYWYFK